MFSLFFLSIFTDLRLSRGGCTMSLLDKLSSYRAEEEKLQWEGTFLDYLPLERPVHLETVIQGKIGCYSCINGTDIKYE